jgi:hypothetical protein
VPKPKTKKKSKSKLGERKKKHIEKQKIIDSAEEEGNND